MKNLKMFCLTMEPSHYNFIKKLNYIPVGLGEKNFNKNCLSDKTGDNISNRNKNYGEYTFHYWLWKNYLQNLDDSWIGFCQYRKFWTLNKNMNQDANFYNLNSKVLKEIPKEFEKYDVILGEPIFINQFRTMKFIKKGLFFFSKRPLSLFNKKKRNIKFHFDFMHGDDNLDKAINLLDDIDRNDFRKFVNTEESFNPHNMFICKSKKKLNDYYNAIFPWLQRCEKLFGFENLEGFGKIRLYAFLAERFMPYWFLKNTNSVTLPIIFYDIRKDLN
jgi:hypothetical protein